MALGLLGKKVGMSQVNDGERGRVAVTVLEVGPCLVVQKKTLERDGYSALTLGFGKKRAKRAPKAEKVRFEKKKMPLQRYLREFRVSVEDLAKFEEGQEIKVDQVFQAGQEVNVAGLTKGRGFTGVMKRWNMKGFDATHGTHEFFRHVGSIGTRKTPGTVHKGKRMPGHYGNERVTVRNLRIVNVLPERNCLVLNGSVPGAANGLVEIVPGA